MKRIIKAREEILAGLEDQAAIIELDKDSFRYYEGADSKPDYFPASIIQKTNADGNTVNDLRVFDEALGNPDTMIPPNVLLSRIKRNKLRRPKCMYCITMYNENFGQLLQSLAGCIRSICELHNRKKEEYSHDKFGIVLVGDGIDKVDPDFMDKMAEFNLFDPEICFNTVLKTNANKETVKRKFEK